MVRKLDVIFNTIIFIFTTIVTVITIIIIIILLIIFDRLPTMWCVSLMSATRRRGQAGWSFIFRFKSLSWW